MSPRARYQIHPATPVLSWQVAVQLQRDISQPRAFLVTVHAYAPGGELLRQQVPGWYWSQQLDADFCYLPPGTADQVLALPPLRHEDPATRIELTVHPFLNASDEPIDVVSTLCFLDQEPVSGQTPRIITTHLPESVHV